MNVLKKFSSILSFSILIAATSANAASRLYCTYDFGEGGCFFKDQKLYNQRLVSDMHCGPTSAAMGLSAITFGGVSYYNNSWTKNNFVYKSEIQRINAFGDLMNTSSTDGTSGSGIKKYSDRYVDIPSATKNVNNADSYLIDDNHLRERIISGEPDILTYGHYVENCLPVGNSQICSFTRNGGHVVAVNGYYAKLFYGQLRFTTHTFDPWEAVEKTRNITKVKNKTTFGFYYTSFDLRPYLSKTQKVYRSGRQVKIIDHINGINTN